MSKDLTAKCKAVFPLPNSAYQIRGGKRGLYFCDANGMRGIITGRNYKLCEELECFNLRYFELKNVPDNWED